MLSKGPSTKRPRLSLPKKNKPASLEEARFGEPVTEREAQEKTNHSLRATGAMRLFRSGVPERSVQSRTGHNSVEALRMYKRVSCMQECSMSSVLGNATNTTTTCIPPQSLQTQPLPIYNFSGCSVTFYSAPLPASHQLKENSPN